MIKRFRFDGDMETIREDVEGEWILAVDYDEMKANWLGPGVTYPCGCRSIGTSNEPPWYCNEHNTESRPLAPDLGEKSSKHDAEVTDKDGERGLGFTAQRDSNS
jgi:hypothetical protein